MKALEECTLEDIIMYRDKKLYAMYNKELDNLKTNRISEYVVNKMYGSKLLDILLKVESELDKNRSSQYFPGDLVLLHLGLKELKSRSFKTCDLSGAIIRPKQLYINYRPLVENLTTGNVYVLKRTIKTEVGYQDYLPTNILELENLQDNIRLETNDNIINYSHLNREIGGELELQKLRRR